MRGITLFEVQRDQIVAGRLYMQEVEREDIGVEDVVEMLSGRRPQAAENEGASSNVGLV